MFRQNAHPTDQQNESQYALSIFKRTVLAELANYNRHMVLGRGLFTTNPQRVNSVSKVLDKISYNDLTFLLNAVEEAFKISDRNSSFRDDVGKTALLQLYKYLTGAIELTALSATLASLANGSSTGSLFFATMILLADSFDLHLQNVARDRGLFETITESINSIGRIRIMQALDYGISSLTIENLYSKGERIGSNIKNLMESCAINLSNLLTADKDTPNGQQQQMLRLYNRM